MKATRKPKAVEAPVKRQLQNTPINRAFLFLYRGVRSGRIKIPLITDTSNQETEQWLPMISGQEYMEKAIDAQIAHETAARQSLATATK